ncbi:hypothetical protein TYRP_006949 [Tyrophagus putrescentiae]|nr:hypothetical protein TYRP_006949 [Tyrophagus putrescentiae]
MKHLFFFSSSSSCSSSPSSNSLSADDQDEEAISPATPSLVTPVTGSPMQPIMRAIEIIEFVSKFSNSEGEGSSGGAGGSFGIAKMHSALEDTDGRGDSEADRLLMKEKRHLLGITKSTDPVTALSSLVVYGVAKAASFLLSLLMHLVAMVNPGILSASKGSSSSPMENMIDYEVITASIRSLPERSFRLLDIPEAACQSRAMCEVGQSVGGYLPAALSRWIRFLAERFNLSGGNDGFNTEAMLRGLAWSDCKSRYSGGCPRSPFKKFQQLMATFSKLY